MGNVTKKDEFGRRYTEKTENIGGQAVTIKVYSKHRETAATINWRNGKEPMLPQRNWRRKTYHK